MPRFHCFAVCCCIARSYSRNVRGLRVAYFRIRLFGRLVNAVCTVCMTAITPVKSLCVGTRLVNWKLVFLGVMWSLSDWHWTFDWKILNHGRSTFTQWLSADHSLACLFYTTEQFAGLGENRELGGKWLARCLINSLALPTNPCGILFFMLICMGAFVYWLRFVWHWQHCTLRICVWWDVKPCSVNQSVLWKYHFD